MKIADFFARLGFEVDDKGVQEFDNKLLGLKSKFALVSAGAVGALYAIDRFIDSSIRGASALSNFNQQTGLSIQKLQEWQSATTLSNPLATIEDVTASVTALQNQLTQIRLGGGNVRPFQLLGIDVMGQNAFGVLEQLRNTVSGMSRPVATNLLQEMGISPQMIQALTLTNKEFSELSQHLVRSKPTQQALARLSIGVNKFKQELSLLKDNLVADMVPALEKLMEVIYRVGGVFDFFWQGFQRIGEEFPNLVKIITMGVAAIAVAMAPITASIAAIMLLIDDFMAYSRGGNSVIGSIKKWASGDEEASAGDDRGWFESLWSGLGKFAKDKNKEFRERKNQDQMLVGINSDIAQLRDLLKGSPNDADAKGALSDLLFERDRYMIEGGTTFNNTYLINSNGDPAAIANTINEKQQQQFNTTAPEFNRGSVY